MSMILPCVACQPGPALCTSWSGRAGHARTLCAAGSRSRPNLAAQRRARSRRWPSAAAAAVSASHRVPARGSEGSRPAADDAGLQQTEQLSGSLDISSGLSSHSYDGSEQAGGRSGIGLACRLSNWWRSASGRALYQ